MTKHAAVGFAEWLAITYGDKGIGVSCVCPMGVDTPCCAACPNRRKRTYGSPAPPSPVPRAVIGPDSVADLVVQAIADRTFLVLPHPRC